MSLHVETNPSLKCRRELYDLNPEAKILAPQMSVGIGQFIALLLCFFFFRFATEYFISMFPKHQLILGKMKTAADFAEATACKPVAAWNAGGNQYPSQRSS